MFFHPLSLFAVLLTLLRNVPVSCEACQRGCGVRRVCQPCYVCVYLAGDRCVTYNSSILVVPCFVFRTAFAASTQGYPRLLPARSFSSSFSVFLMAWVASDSLFNPACQLLLLLMLPHTKGVAAAAVVVCVSALIAHGSAAHAAASAIAVAACLSCRRSLLSQCSPYVWQKYKGEVGSVRAALILRLA